MRQRLSMPEDWSYSSMQSPVDGQPTSECSSLFVIVIRYLGGDQTLIAEMLRNNDFQRTIPKKGTQINLEVQDHKIRILPYSWIDVVERVTSLLRGLEDGTLAGPMKPLLQDATKIPMYSHHGTD